jgi:hypothetical protein
MAPLSCVWAPLLARQNKNIIFYQATASPSICLPLRLPSMVPIIPIITWDRRPSGLLVYGHHDSGTHICVCRGTKGAWFCRFWAHSSLKLGHLEKKLQGYL